MDVFAEIDQARRECDVLEHPFYERWSAGALSERELGVYAGEYRHAVVALAEVSRKLAGRARVEDALAPHAGALRRHAAEESAHVALWEQFASAAGAQQAQPLPQTRDCARAWTGGEEPLEHLAVLYAIEASQPEIAATKLRGLVDRYGYSAEGPATEYFRVHATLDVEHARQALELGRALLAGVQRPQALDRARRMAARARAALRANWQLLDGVEQRCAARLQR
jgi:pyrroloquinoline-quinone synthase